MATITLRRIIAGVSTMLVIGLMVVACSATAASGPASNQAPATSQAASTPAVAPTPTIPLAPTAAPTSEPMAAPTATSAATTSQAVTVKTATDPKLGEILVDGKGMTLYLYTKDEPNVTNCYGQCATNWPPLAVKEGQPEAAPGVTGKLGTITRTDGSQQVTYNGMPLYYWAKDTKPGDTTGQNVGSVWFVISPTQAGFPTVKVTKNADLGNIVTDLKGMTLYKYTKDTAGNSTCYGQCATNWPPLIVKDGEPVPQVGMPGKLGTITRQDGSKQVTLDGVPLYYWVKDTKAGDTTGQGVGSVWYVIPVK